jgi:hypothetical protein
MHTPIADLYGNRVGCADGLSAVGGSVDRRTAPWFRIRHAERRVGQALYPYVVIELRKVGSCKRV